MGEVTLLKTLWLFRPFFNITASMCANKLAGLQMNNRLYGRNVNSQLPHESSDEEEQKMVTQMNIPLSNSTLIIAALA